MAYKALYRTYRPQKFNEVIGQDHIVRTLQNSLINNKISHAYLFTGPRGTGKTSIARILAKALNCKNPHDGEPCKECINCREISESNSPDVVEIDAASNNGVDEIREIRDKVKFLPAGSRYKVYIIDEVHMLSSGAFNALLKTLEEPPKHVVFILATTEPHKVLPTIISRCLRFDFKALTVKEIVSLIERVANEENFKISEEAVVAIAEGAEGGLRDALGYLDQAASFTDDDITIDDVNNITGNLNYNKMIELAVYFQEKNINESLRTINELVIMGKEISKIVNGMLQFYRDILLYINIDTSKFPKYIFEKEDFKNLAGVIEANTIFYYVDVLSDIQNKIKFASNPGIYLDVAVIKIINGVPNLDYSQRIDALEEAYASGGGLKGSGIEVDSQKVNLLEAKLIKVVNELSRLELPQLQVRVSELELNMNKPLTSVNSASTTNIDFERRLTSIEGSLKGLEKLVDHVTEELNDSKYRKPVVSDDNSILRTEIDKLSLEVERLAITEDKHEINEIIEKLNSLEEKVFKLIKDHDIDKNTRVRISRKKIVSGQISLDEAIENKQSTLVIDARDNINSEAKDIRFNQLEFESIEEENSQKPAMGQDSSPIISKTEDEEDHNGYSEEDEKIEVVDDIYEEDYQSAVEEHQRTIDKIEVYKTEVIRKLTPEEEIVVSPHSQLVRRIGGTINVGEEGPSIYNDALIDQISKKVEEKTEGKELNEIPIISHKVNPLSGLYDNDYNSYSVIVIERILHSSRTQEARTDQGRIVNLWKGLIKNTDLEYASYAELLQEGTIVVVGNKEFILSYPNSAICNQVMKIKFKEVALKLLYNYFGDIYNYMALPDSIWKEKRTEYINQYNIGVRLPKLTAINDPSLYVNKDEDENYSHQAEMAKNAKRLFGGIVEIE